VLASSASELRAALESAQAHDMRGLANFIVIADERNPQTLDELLVSLDADKCLTAWTSRLEDAGTNAEALVRRAAQIDGAVGDVARHLLDNASG
jgi:hypothetical protein